MLSEIDVRNYALIDQLSLRFGNGFNVLTGETGAGKSLVIDCVGLVIGGGGSSVSVACWLWLRGRGGGIRHIRPTRCGGARC